MIGNFATIFSIFSPTLLLVLVGYLWVKTGNIFETRFLTKLITFIGSPCLIFGTLSQIRLPEDVIFTMLLAGFLAHFIFGLSGFLLLAFLRLRMQVYLPVMLINNGGNLGLPICLFAFGEDGLALAMVYFVIQALTMFSVGIAIYAGTFSLPGISLSILRMPLIYAAVLGIYFAFSQQLIPQWILNTVDLTGGFVIPLMLISLGSSVALMQSAHWRQGAILALARIAIGFLTGLGLVWLLAFEGMAAGVLILQCSMPAAVYSYLFAKYYERSPDEVASMVLASTLISIVILPLVIYYVLHFV